MKKKVIIGIVVLTVLAVAWCAIPHSLVGNSYQLDYVEYQGETIHFHDESSKAEREEIEALLRAYQRSAVLRRGQWGGYGSLCLLGFILAPNDKEPPEARRRSRRWAR